MSQSKRLYWIYAALALALTAAAGLVVFTVQGVADQQNNTSIETQKAITNSLTQSLLESLSGTLTAEGYWDEAYNATVRRWDQSWIDWEYGGYLPSLDVEKSLIFGTDGSLKFAHETDTSTATGRAALSRDAGIQALLAAVRRTPPQSSPKVERGFLVLNGAVYYAVASYILPDTAAAIPGRRDVLMMVRELRPERLHGIGTLSAGSGFAVLPLDRQAQEKVSIPLLDISGKPVANLWWTPNRPGAVLMSTMVPVALMIFAALGAVLLMLFSVGRQILAHAFASEAKALAAYEEARTKTAFLANLSHDLRTPLNAIIGFSDVLSKETRGPLGDPRYKEYVNHIYSSGNHLLRIINDLLDLARLDARQATLDCSVGDVRAEVEEACSMLQLEADRAGIELVRPAGRIALYGWCDSRSLLRVLINLLGNAIKFTPAGGRVTVEVEEDEKHVLVRVSDTGVGIKAEDIEKLGRPFMQVGNHLTNQKQGTGLGLSICKGLLEMMGGSLCIESQYGLGTTVTITLKRQLPEEQIATGSVRAA